MVAEMQLDPRDRSVKFPVKSDNPAQRIVLVVEDGDVAIDDIDIRYGQPGRANTVDGPKEDPRVAHTFRNGARIREVDLIGNRNVIVNMDVRYRVIAGRPRLQVWFANKPPQAMQSDWNRDGYAMVGETHFDVRGQMITVPFVDRERVPSRLMIVVEEGDVEITGVTIHHGDPRRPGAGGPKHELAINHTFNNASRNRAIELPRMRRPVRAIDVRYRSTSGRPVIQIWAEGLVAANPPPSTRPLPPPQTQPVPTPAPTPAPRPTPPRPAEWDRTGWTKLTENALDLRRQVQSFRTPKSGKSPQRLMVVVENGDVEVENIIVHHTRGHAAQQAGDSIDTKVAHAFTNASRTRQIDLSGNRKPIVHVEVKYRNPTGRPRVELWAQGEAPAEATPAPTPAPPPSGPMPKPPSGYENEGWMLLGEQTVTGKSERDTVKVARGEGRFSKLLVVVEGGDLEMHEMKIKTEKARPVDVAVRNIFRAGSTTREIPLPEELTVIKFIQFRYGNLTPGAQAKVKVYAK